MDGKVAPEDEVAAVLDLLQRVVPAQIDGVTVVVGELGAYYQASVLKPGANQLGAERIGGGLPRRGISHPQEGVVVFAERHPRTAQLLFDEVMSIEVIGDGKGQE